MKLNQPKLLKTPPWLEHHKGINEYVDSLVLNKIMLVKHTRLLTVVLGKLGLKCCRYRNEMYFENQRLIQQGLIPVTPRPPAFAQSPYGYGWGLKESKDYVERIVDKIALSAKARTTST